MTESAPRLLIVGGYHPGSPAMGGVLLAEIARIYPKDRLSAFAYRRYGPASREFDWMPTVLGDGLPEEGVSRSPSRAARALSVPVRLWRWRKKVDALVAQAVALGREQQVEMVWGVVYFLTDVLMIRRVAEELKVPYATTVWDPPDYIAHYLHLDRASQAFVMREFERMQRGSAGCAVASPQMAEEYARLYNPKTFLLRLGVPRRWWKPPQSAPRRTDELTICFTGALYATREFAALLRALESRQWRLAGRQVRLRLLTPSVTLNLGAHANVECLGYRPAQEALEHLHQSDIGYVPYWLDPWYERAARLSFPCKICTCLSAGRPIFYHGPEYGSPMAFLAQYGAGFSCNSNEPEAIAAAIEEFFSRPERYAQATQGGRRAIEEELNCENYVRRFAQMLGADPASLLRAMELEQA